MSKKIRITEVLIRKVEQVFHEGTGSLTRPQLRALHRKGYLVRKAMRADTGAMYYEYALKSTF